MAITTIFGASNFTIPTWVENPETRGTWDLIQTCVLTLGICVYSALHLNVFHRQSAWWGRWLIRCKWMVVALLAPEFIVFNAWSQRRQASRIAHLLRRRSGQVETESHVKLLRTRLGARFHREPDIEQASSYPGQNEVSENKPSDYPHPERFQITHGFAIVMGGLVVDMTDDENRVWPEWCNSLTITPACVEDCLDGDAFRGISLDFLTLQSINGRSKSDGLTKCIVILQAVWFCLQCLARIHQQLPVSLLELNTFAHALCALIIYILWWNKPGEISDPFVIPSRASDELRDLCAAQWTLGAMGKHYERHRLQQTKAKGVLVSSWEPTFTHGGSTLVMNFFRGRNNLTLAPGYGEEWYLFDHTREERWLYFPRHPQTSQLRLRSRYPKGRASAIHLHPGQPISGTNTCIDSQFASIEIDQVTLNRWQHTLRFPQKYHNNYAVWLRDRQPNFNWPRGLDTPDGHAIADELTRCFLMFLATSLCYGALHLLAWDSGVLQPQTAQDTWWKTASLLLVGLGPLAFALWAIMKLVRGPDAHLNLNMAMSAVGLCLFVVPALLAYAAARIYLVVEVFYVLPYMDPGVYEMPRYSLYWPHFG